MPRAKVYKVIDREKLVQKLINECLYKEEPVDEIKHKSLNESRLKREPLEARFLEEWKKQAPHTLGYLLYGQDTWKHDVTQREAEVAATVIQWLGSSVGQFFLESIKEKP